MPKSVGLTADEAGRYSRQIVLQDFGPEGQRLLKGSAVLVVGMGGLGVPASVYLASAGVGSIGIVDYDTVDFPNLHRQFLYTDADIGRKKVHVARDRLARLNPHTKVTAYDLKLDSGSAMEVIGDYDVVIDATDNLPARYLLSDACTLLGKPDVYASVLGFDGQVTVFYPPRGPCYRCLFPEPPSPSEVKSCEDFGVLGVVPGIMGGLQANQAIELLVEKGSPLVGRLLIFNATDNSFDEVKLKRDPSCPTCGKRTITSLIDYEEFCGTKAAESKGFDITVGELKSSIDRDDDILLLDVREPNEYSICHLPGSRLIPLGEVSSRKTELDKERPIVVYCHVGVRSTSATSYLRKEGFRNVRNLRGGIEAWAIEIDTRMPRY